MKRLRDLERAVDARLGRFDRDGVPRRIWGRDHTVWQEDPTEVADRLGWLTVADDMDSRVDELEGFAATASGDGLTDAVLLGMGGSSLAPEVFRESFGVADGALDLHVLDTTHPEQILALERSLDLDRTLFLVASKSGTTLETRSHLDHFWEGVGEGSRFVAITDPGTPLADLAAERGFRQVFLNPPDIGGRYSALSLFGLVPAALIGADLRGLLASAREVAAECGPAVPPRENPGIWLGTVMGEAAARGMDKLTLVLPERIASFGAWIEQLVAESTGKGGRGVLPVEGETLGPPAVYGEDRLFVGLGDAGYLTELEEDGHPVVVLPFAANTELGGQMFEWELATAVAGAVLGIQPFDQPDVGAAKEATARALERRGGARPDRGDLRELLGSARPGDYLAIQAYLPRTPGTAAHLHGIRMALRDRLRLATTVGFGPRFLHSTGQLHKGGPPTGMFVQVVEPPAEDLPVPGSPFTFGELLAAQADGDLEALRARGRRAVRVSLTELEAVASG
ncbi:MAG: glucose-6-phosphate isomerase [Actinobacteria bacterium]|nr:glucose-6-phosphate isomerase [Actinomycetota bacterium]